jgi:hypothetical protein
MDLYYLFSGLKLNFPSNISGDHSNDLLGAILLILLGS